MRTFKQLQAGDTVYRLSISLGGHRGIITEHTVTLIDPEFISLQDSYDGIPLTSYSDPTFSINSYRQKTRKPSGELVIYTPSYEVVVFYLKNYFISHMSLLFDKRKSESSIKKYL